jgi:hypothetical protein
MQSDPAPAPPTSPSARGNGRRPTVDDRVNSWQVPAQWCVPDPYSVASAPSVRTSCYDGRLYDLGTAATASFIPLISSNWTESFGWLGTGPFPAAERDRLRALVGAAHRGRRRVRFWATPDAAGPERDAVWTELLAAGVDHLNTDDPAGLEPFLRARNSPVRHGA